jgi:hypothetical protein
VVVVFEVVVSVESAKANGTVANNAATLRAKVAVFKECFTMMSPLVLKLLVLCPINKFTDTLEFSEY